MLFINRIVFTRMNHIHDMFQTGAKFGLEDFNIPEAVETCSKRGIRLDAALKTSVAQADAASSSRDG